MTKLFTWCIGTNGRADGYSLDALKDAGDSFKARCWNDCLKYFDDHECNLFACFADEKGFGAQERPVGLVLTRVTDIGLKLVSIASYEPGAGKALVEHIQETAKALDMAIWCKAHNDAWGFYRKLGFTGGPNPAGDGWIVTMGDGSTAWLMWWQ